MKPGLKEKLRKRLRALGKGKVVLAKFGDVCGVCGIRHIVAGETDIEPWGKDWAASQCIVRASIALQVIERTVRDCRLTEEQLRSMDRMDFLRMVESKGVLKPEHVGEVKDLLVWYWKGILTKKMR